MEFAKLIRNDSHYSYKGSSSIKMDIISNFLSDVGCNKFSYSFKNWATADKEKNNDGFTYSYGSNATFLEDEKEEIFLHDRTSRESENYTKMTRQQFIQLLDDWQEKVCGPRPKEVIIKYENDQYSIETSN